MNFERDYYYTKYDGKKRRLSDTQIKKLKTIKNNKLFNKISQQSKYTYIILNVDDLMGFFTINLEDTYIQISSLYICREYRNRNIATEIIEDIIFYLKYDIRFNIHCIMVNSYSESALFFIKKGFDFYKINNQLSNEKKKIIEMYKTF